MTNHNIDKTLLAEYVKSDAQKLNAPDLIMSSDGTAASVFSMPNPTQLGCEGQTLNVSDDCVSLSPQELDILAQSGHVIQGKNGEFYLVMQTVNNSESTSDAQPVHENAAKHNLVGNGLASTPVYSITNSDPTVVSSTGDQLTTLLMNSLVDKQQPANVKVVDTEKPSAKKLKSAPIKNTTFYVNSIPPNGDSNNFIQVLSNASRKSNGTPSSGALRLSKPVPDSSTIKKRVSHNEVERKRRDQINLLINELQTMLPNAPQGLSKGQILRNAIDYFRDMDHYRVLGENAEKIDQENARLHQVVENLDMENQQMKRQISLLTTQSSCPGDDVADPS